MKPPKSPKQVCAFIGLLEYYRDMWVKSTHLLHPLTALTSNKVNFNSTDV